MDQELIRTFRPQDIEPAVALINLCVASDGVGQRFSVQRMRNWLSRPPVRPECDWFVAEAGGQHVGLALLYCEPRTRLVYWLSVHPAWRDGALGQRLLERCLAHAQTFQEPVLDIPVRPGEDFKRRLVESLGFRHVRSWWRMRIELSHPVPQPQWPAGFTLRAFQRGADELLLTDLVNEVFADHWGEGQHSLEEIEHEVSEPHFEPDLLLFLQSGGQPVGYVWSWVYPEMAQHTRDQVAYIGDLGIVASYRQRGLGRALLLHALSDLQVRGQVAAELEVDGPNAGAKHLYESVGFYEKEEIFWYRKDVGQKTEYGAQDT